jgi:hypothetical protein
MPSFLNPNDREQLAERIGRLHAGSAALWGKMNVAQMLAHSQKPLEVSLGQLNLPVSIFGKLAGGYFKKKFASGKPFSKNLPTVPQFRTHQLATGFDEARQQFLGKMDAFAQAAASNQLSTRHPFFGKLSPDDWGTLLYAHTDHHLKQFGV